MVVQIRQVRTRERPVKTRENGGGDRNRTDDKGFAGPCLTTWRRRPEKSGGPELPATMGSGLPPAAATTRPREAGSGAGDEIRTRDFLLGKQMLYH